MTAEVLTPAFTLESLTLFDVYQGAGVAEGNKSLAFALNFRSMERTLTDDEVGSVFARLQEKLKASGWQLRG